MKKIISMRARDNDTNWVVGWTVDISKDRFPTICSFGV
jgi:hypothetical protein